MKSLKTKSQEDRLYQIPVPIIGLTGGIGTGKSSAAEFLRQMNVPVIDADKLVHSIYNRPETLEFIKNHFPHACSGNNIDRKILREIVFADESKKKELENFIYQYMPEEFRNAFLKFTSPRFIVYDVPLLFEKKLNELVDASICVYAPKELQIERVMKRDQSSRELAIKIIESQIDIESKKNKADIVISNTGNQDFLRDQIKKIISEIAF